MRGGDGFSSEVGAVVPLRPVQHLKRHRHPLERVSVHALLHARCVEDITLLGIRLRLRLGSLRLHWLLSGSQQRRIGRGRGGRGGRGGGGGEQRRRLLRTAPLAVGARLGGTCKGIAPEEGESAPTPRHGRVTNAAWASLGRAAGTAVGAMREVWIWSVASGPHWRVRDVACGGI